MCTLAGPAPATSISQLSVGALIDFCRHISGDIAPARVSHLDMSASRLVDDDDDGHRRQLTA